MGDKVNVLAVLDDLTVNREESGAPLAIHNTNQRTGKSFADELREVRTAVAELIAADREYDKARDSLRAAENCDGPERVRRNYRVYAAANFRAAALARFGGVR